MTSPGEYGQPQATQPFHGSVASCLAGIGDESVFADWDTDYDGFLDDDEFGIGMDAYGVDYDPTYGYDAWDYDEDGLLSEDEFNRGTFDELDSDDDGRVDMDEWGIGLEVGAGM